MRTAFLNDCEASFGRSQIFRVVEVAANRRIAHLFQLREFRFDLGARCRRVRLRNRSDRGRDSNKGESGLNKQMHDDDLEEALIS